MEQGLGVQPLILMVEDHPLIIEFVESHLKRAGFHVIAAEGCAEALALLRQYTPDLIILDVVLDDGLGV
ncbi:MAG: response regulator [Blastochloris sp.]|nr:response regulator [Blastochloris sp.]